MSLRLNPGISREEIEAFAKGPFDDLLFDTERELVEDDEVQAGQIAGETSLAAGADAAAGDGEVGLARAGAADEDAVACSTMKWPATRSWTSDQGHFYRPKHNQRTTQEQAAVAAGLTEPWSNGQTER